MIAHIRRTVGRLTSFSALPSSADPHRTSSHFAVGLFWVALIMLAANGVAPLLHMPPVVVALGLGLSVRAALPTAALAGESGIKFCCRQLLKIGIALLGLRVVGSNLAALGFTTLLILCISVLLTLAGGYFIARLLGQNPVDAAISSTSVAICGASAALAASSVLPDDGDKERQTGLVVLVVSILSTVVMVVYPLLGHVLGLAGQPMAILLGGAIHDVAQVAGAGMSVSPKIGVQAVMVKMVRVACLLPVVASLSFFFCKAAATTSARAPARVPVPWFLIGFLLCALLASSGLFPTVWISTAGNVAALAILAAVGAIGLLTGPKELMSVHPMLVLTMVLQTLWQLALICLLIYLIWQ